jgi:hypothetical protein
MKSLGAISLGLAALLSTAAASPIELEERAATVKGFDISAYQPNVDFKKAYAGGARFVIIKVIIPPLFPAKLGSRLGC